GHRHDRDGVLRDAGRVELRERGPEQRVRDVAVRASDNDADAATGAARLAFEQVDVVGDVELAGGVLVRDAQPRLLVLRLLLDGGGLGVWEDVLRRLLAGPG